jgi:hypothetical protein
MSTGWSSTPAAVLGLAGLGDVGPAFTPWAISTSLATRSVNQNEDTV